MLLILSPSKTMVNADGVSKGKKFTLPRYQKEASVLIETVRKYTGASLATLMKISEKLALHTTHLHGQFQLPSSASVPAFFAYTGEVYRGLAALSMPDTHLAYAQKHVVILSGMYGALRPLDLIKPYRLEIGLSLKVGKHNNLYEFWGSKIADALKAELETHKDQYIVNLASGEYFKAVDKFLSGINIIHIDFYEWHREKWVIQSVYAKKARGLMCRFAIDNALKKTSDLQKFEAEGYAFNTELSTSDHWVFTRKLKAIKAG
ncbi:MAG: peroxide stress protein YaaA [Saprospiraceae bacterium]|nr:peroxide stress protein YaaA [Saprospiraceae bacterium]